MVMVLGFPAVAGELGLIAAAQLVATGLLLLEVVLVTGC
jgi:hypothetical protein